MKKLVVGEGCAVCRNAVITGAVTVRSKGIVHPNAVLAGQGGPIVIGAGTIIEEFAQVINSSPSQMAIGAGCVLEAGCHVESSSLGDGCLVQSRARVPRGCVLGSGCMIGVGVELAENTHVPDNTAIFHDAGHSRVVPDLVKRNMRAAQMESDVIFSAKLLEANHRLYEAGNHDQ